MWWRACLVFAEQSIDLFMHAGQPTELHLVAEVDHFMLAENNTVVQAVFKSWLDKYFPVSAPVSASVAAHKAA